MYLGDLDILIYKDISRASLQMVKLVGVRFEQLQLKVYTQTPNHPTSKVLYWVNTFNISS